MHSIEHIAKNLAGKKSPQRNGDGFKTRCPAHDDENFSLSIGPGKKQPIIVKCHAGCTGEEVIEELKQMGLWPESKTAKKSSSGKTKPNIVASYDYVNEQGELLYQSVRLEPKSFRQCAADGSWKVKHIEKVPYRLPAVIAAQEVMIVEGEKDADRLAKLGIVATTNVAGAGKWTQGLNHWFKGTFTSCRILTS